MSKDKDDEMDAQQRRLEDSLQQLLANELVCENIASFMSLPDMKAVSEVNRQFLQVIRGTRRFAQTAVLKITDENHEDMRSVIRRTEYTWRGVKVNLKNPTNILQDLPRVLKSVEFVSLEGRPWRHEYPVVKDATAVSLLTAFLSSTPKLSQLKIDIQFLLANVGDVLSSPEVQETMKNLKRLELVKKMPRFDSDLHYFSNSTEKDTFWSNFDSMTRFSNRLKCFKLIPLTPSDRISINNLHSMVLRLLGNNKATLEHLELHLIVWPTQEIQTLVLPTLKTLIATTDEYDEEGMNTLVEFLNNHMSLEELTLECKSLDERLMASIGGRSGKLKKLDLRAFEFPETVDWSFLAGMTCLAEFRFYFRNKRGLEGVCSRLLALLPQNQLRSLILESPQYGSYKFWNEDESAALESKTELLRGFRCLRKLRLEGWEDAVDDQLMQWLLKEFLLLEELEISDCRLLSNAGISGATSAEWGRNASLSDLRGLKSLKIQNCPEVTNEGVAMCVNLPFLKLLEYSSPFKIHESVVLALAAQNPRLEKLCLNFGGDYEFLQARVREASPRMNLVRTRPNLRTFV